MHLPDTDGLFHYEEKTTAPSALGAYLEIRKTLNEKVLFLLKNTEWNGYELAAKDVSSEIDRVDKIIISLSGKLSSTESYPSEWARVVLMVSPAGEMHAIGGDREVGEGDTAYVGLERIKKYLESARNSGRLR